MLIRFSFAFLFSLTRDLDNSDYSVDYPHKRNHRSAKMMKNDSFAEHFSINSYDVGIYYKCLGGAILVDTQSYAS